MLSNNGGAGLHELMAAFKAFNQGDQQADLAFSALKLLFECLTDSERAAGDLGIAGKDSGPSKKKEKLFVCDAITSPALGRGL